jgi:hypothetical protein
VERCRTEQVHAHVVLGEVVARRQTSLLEAHRPVGLGQQFAVESNLDMGIGGLRVTVSPRLM